MDGHDDPVDAGEELLGQPTASGRRRLGYGLAALLLVGGVTVGLVTRGHGGHHQSQSTRPPNTASADSSADSHAPAPSTAVSGPVVRTVALPDIGPVQLFARVANAVVRLDFAASRVITTAVPTLRSTGPVTFGVTETGAYVRPIDVVPGYFVPDAGPVRELTGALADRAVLPGPDSESVWIEHTAGDKLLGFREVYVPTSAVTSRLLPVPASIGRIWAPPQADGSGYVLISGEHGTFDLRPDGAHRLPPALLHDTMLAAGNNRLLVAICPSPELQRCPVSLVHLPGGRVSRVGSTLAVSGLLTGVIAPDARTALIYQPDGAGQLGERLFDLDTGRFRGPAVPVDSEVQAGAVTYSPDGAWVFMVGAGGTLIMMDARTGAVQRIDAGLPVVYQLAVRS